MKKEKLFEELGKIDTDLVLEAAPGRKSIKGIRSRTVLLKCAAACIALVLAIGGIIAIAHLQNKPQITDEPQYPNGSPFCDGSQSSDKPPFSAEVAKVCLDVNPGIEIKIDSSNNVIDVAEVNPEGKEVIGNVDFTGKSIEETIVLLTKSMIEKGYINKKTNYMLLTIESDYDMAELESKLMEELAVSIKEIDGKVIVQQIEKAENLSEIAAKYGITVGKAELIKSISEKYEEMTLETLAKMTITELSSFLYTNEAKAEIEYELPRDIQAPEGWMSPREAFDLAIQRSIYAPNDVKELKINTVIIHGEVYEFEVYYRLFDYHGTVTLTVHGMTGEIIVICNEGGKLESNYITITQANGIALEHVKDIYFSIKSVIGTTGGGLDAGIWHYVFEIDGKNYDNEEIKYMVYVDAQTGKVLELTKK